MNYSWSVVWREWCSHVNSYLNHRSLTMEIAALLTATESLRECDWFVILDSLKRKWTYNKCSVFVWNKSKANFISAMGGLSLVMTPEIDENQTSVYSDGIKILVHETGVFGASTSFEKMISHKTETFVRLSTVVTTCSDEVRQLPYSDRGCLYESERQLKYIIDIIDVSIIK